MRQICIAIIVAVLSSHAFAAPSADLVYNLKGSVAKIHTVTKSGGHGVGSGVVVSKNHIATNCHVLANANGINATALGDTFSPMAIQEDWRHDICILRFEYLPLKPVTLGDNEKPQYEQAVFSIGFAGGPPRPLTTYGNIKALYPLDDGFIIRTSASFVLGASGSPIFDDEGKLLGLNTFKSPGRHGFFYGVPVKWVKQLLAAPENNHIGPPGIPFWDMPEGQRPYLMRVVLPAQNEKWSDLNNIARAWVNKEPNNAEAYYYLGLAQQNLGQTEPAQRQYQQAVQLNPRHTASLLALGKIAAKQGDQAEVQRLTLLLKELDSAAVEELKAQ
ncbi:MAG: trypsin-like peptidase domain-containing protein [Methylophilaceae bacterium]